VEVVNLTLLKEFATKHGQARQPLRRWLELVERSTWSNHADLKAVFLAADYKNGKYVFNIKGNSYRLIAIVIFTGKVVIIDGVYTHEEYNKLRL